MNQFSRPLNRKSQLAIALIFAALPLALPARAGSKPLTVDLVTNEQQIIPPRARDIQWRPGDHEISYIRNDNIWIYDVSGGGEHRLGISSDDLDLDSYQWSPDGAEMLFQGDSDLWLLNVSNGSIEQLTHDPTPEEEPAFSPDGKSVAFVKLGNLYVLSLADKTTKQLTKDGSTLILNGKLDWVYKEELANRSTGRAYEWSPDSKQIAYLRLDDTPVPRYPLVSFLSTHAAIDFEQFPQPGDPNPAVSFRVASVDGHSTYVWSSTGIEYIGPSFTWEPDSSAVAFLTLNRDQTDLKVHLWNPDSVGNKILVEEKDPYWINSLDPPHFLSDGRFLWLSERDGWLHLYLMGSDGSVIRKLTTGNWMIDHPLFSDSPMIQLGGKSGWVYFECTKPDPRQRQIDRVNLNGGPVEQLSKEPGTHALALSPDGRYYVDTFSDYQTPPVARVFNSSGMMLASLDKDHNHLGEYNLGTTEFVTVKAADGTELYARLVKPPNFDSHKKYPVIVKVYGGPHVQIVRAEWGVTSLEDQIFAEQGYVLWSLDNRGSWGRGHAFETPIFEHLGQVELKDQLAGIKYLKSLPYVDSSRMGIWGWSYGGYMTLYTLTNAPGVFKCGAAGGPVTDWKFYDSIYTERYMRTPAVNDDGYTESSVVNAARNLQAKLLLMHGVDDDNVHLQNTINFIEALVRNGKSYQLYLQPGEKHGFSSYSARTYLLQRMLNFFAANLKN